MILARHVHLAATAALLAACAQPGATSSGTAAIAGSGKPATTCTMTGLEPGSMRISRFSAPSMTLSNDGFCAQDIMVNSWSSASAAVTPLAQPKHGRISVSNAGIRATLRYDPEMGYEGPDSFTVGLDPSGQARAEIKLLVVKP